MTTDSSEPLDRLDGEACFIEAGESFASWSMYPISPEHAARVLSKLAKAGLIVSVEQHEEVCDGYAAQLQQVSDAADDLVGRLNGGGDQ